MTACGSDPSETPCEAAALSAALASAKSGDTIRLGACMISGSFEVPAGVALEGLAPAQTIFTSSSDAPPLVLVPGTPATRVRNLAVDSNARAGILAIGPGSVELSHLQLRAQRGYGLAFEGLDQLVMDDVSALGPVDASNADPISLDPDPAGTATHGMIVLRVSSAELNTVRAEGFAATGAVLIDSTSAWRGGSASDNLGAGILVSGGSATLEDLAVDRTLKGLSPVAYGVVATASASIDSARLAIRRGEGYGVFHLGAPGRHLELDVEDNDDAGLWIQRVRNLEASGRLLRNRLAGIAAIDSAELSIHDAQLHGTRKKTRISGAGGRPIIAGDGLELVRSTDSIALRDLTAEGNERVGFLFELGGASATGITISGISVTVTSTTQAGLVTQGGTPAPEWEMNIVRVGTTGPDDDRLSGTFDTVEIVGPCFMPVEDLQRTGLGALAP